MKIGEVWVYQGNDRYKAEFRASITLSGEEVTKASVQGYIKELTLEILERTKMEVQMHIDQLKVEGFDDVL